MPITRYDRSPLDQCIAERDRFQEELGCWKSSFPGLSYGFAALKMAGLQIDLKSHKEALEKAKCALESCKWGCNGDGYGDVEEWRFDRNSVKQAISAINDLLDKKGDK